jgi:hypothetical protein
MNYSPLPVPRFFDASLLSLLVVPWAWADHSSMFRMAMNRKGNIKTRDGQGHSPNGGRRTWTINFVNFTKDMVYNLPRSLSEHLCAHKLAKKTNAQNALRSTIARQATVLYPKNPTKRVLRQTPRDQDDRSKEKGSGSYRKGRPPS